MRGIKGDETAPPPSIFKLYFSILLSVWTPWILGHELFISELEMNSMHKKHFLPVSTRDPLNEITENVIIHLMLSTFRSPKSHFMHLIIVIIYSVWLYTEVITFRGFYCTVKPALTTTSKQWPPVNNDRYNSGIASLNLTFIRAPISNIHFCQVPMVAVVHRFDCKWKTHLTF